MRRKIFLLTIAMMPWVLMAEEPTDSMIIEALNANFPEAAHPEHVFSHLTSIYKDKTFAISTGGCLIATVSNDFGNVMDNPNEFKAFDIPMQRHPGDNSLTQISAQQSHIYLNAIALPCSKNQVGAFLKVNLLGEKYTPAVEYALISYRGFTVGYDYTMFADMGAMISTIDYEGPCAYTAVSNAGVHYHHRLSENLGLGLAAELPIPSATCHKCYLTTQSIPDIVAAMKYAWAEGESWVRIAGLVRDIKYRDEVSDKTNYTVTWGAEISGKLQVGALGFTYQGTYGKGITSYYQDFTDGGMDLMPSTKDGGLETVESWGAYAGLQYNFTDDIYASLGYSQVRAYPEYYADGEVAWDDQCRYAQNAIGNVFWNVNDYITLGAEYIYGRRKNMNSLQGHDNRLQAMIRISF